MAEARQAEDMTLAWAKVQEKMWEQWMKGLESSRVQPQYAEVWERASNKIIDSWANTVKLALHAQLDYTRLWVHRLSEQERAPNEVVEYAQQTYEIMQAWIEAQLEMWDCWFSGMRKLGPVETTTAFIDVMKSWQEAVRKSLEAEAAWMHRWEEQTETT